MYVLRMDVKMHPYQQWCCAVSDDNGDAWYSKSKSKSKKTLFQVGTVKQIKH